MRPGSKKKKKNPIDFWSCSHGTGKWKFSLEDVFFGSAASPQPELSQNSQISPVLLLQHVGQKCWICLQTPCRVQPKIHGLGSVDAARGEFLASRIQDLLNPSQPQPFLPFQFPLCGLRESCCKLN